MKHWKDVLITPDMTILKAMELIDASALQIALVVDEGGRLLGTVTDGDVRRGLLKGKSLELPVSEIMFREPTVASGQESREAMIALMKERHLRQIPLVDEERRVIGLDRWEDLIDIPTRENAVVLMAGGLGTRLGELTRDCPKPMLRVGDKPVLETILDSCKEYGFRNFYISVNYKAEMVMDYFGDGSRFGVSITYLHEKTRLGTAGALSLLPVAPAAPLVVMNADVLTKVNFKHLLEFHEEHSSAGTMCVREYEFQVPFGVVQVQNHRLKEIQEKPVHRFFVNAGIYVLNPEAVALVPKDQFFDMPSLFELLLKEKLETTAFPIREYWLDIGRVDDFRRANDEFGEVFS